MRTRTVASRAAAGVSGRKIKRYSRSVDDPVAKKHGGFISQSNEGVGLESWASTKQWGRKVPVI